MKRWTSIEQIRAANKRAGERFFDPDILEWWDTKFTETIIRDRYFITSEAPAPEGERRYTVRRVNDDGRIETVGEIRGHRDREAAYHATIAAALDERHAREQAERDRAEIRILR